MVRVTWRMICHMSDDTITKLPDPSGILSDPLTDVIRGGARKLIEQAIEAELAALLSAFADHKLEDGRARLVRHGHLPERDILTGDRPCCRVGTARGSVAQIG
jgi:putative transposase